MLASVYFRKAFIYFCLVAFVVGICCHVVRASGSASSQAYQWAHPSAMALQKVGLATDVPNQPNTESNLDCTTLAYRRVSSSTMQTGCFMPTAFGMVDPDSQMVIYNGTDEGLPLLSYSPHELLTPWAKSGSVLALDAAVTGGEWLSLYKDLLSHLDDRRDILGQLTGKQVNQPPDIILRDASSKALAVNEQTLAFSDNASWLAVETLGGAFVRINLASLDSFAFAPSFGSQGSPLLYKSQVAISNSGRFAVIQSNVDGSFIIYDLANCAPKVSAAYQNCPSYDYATFLKSQIVGLGTISHVRFMNEGLISFTAHDASGTHVYELAPTSSIGSLAEYVALGDSYTSGEGAFDYLSGTDTDDNVCHLSVNSYPLLITRQLFSPSSGHSVACSGARLQDIIPTKPGDYRGQVSGGIPRQQRTDDAVEQLLADFMPGYLAQSEFVSNYQPAHLTVSIGGNDVGFGSILQTCVEAKLSRHMSDNTCFNTYEDRLEIKNLIDRTIPRWIAAFTYLQQHDPRGQILAIGYPQIVSDTGDCAANVHLGKSELEFAIEMIDYINSGVAQAAASAGVGYVDISQALAGHRLCETTSYNVAVNGLTAGRDAGIFGVKFLGKESYHPNALGQSLIADAILRQTQNFQLQTPNSSTIDSGESLLDAPRSGRAVAILSWDDTLTSELLSKQTTTTVHYADGEVSLKPNTTYTIRIDGNTGTIAQTIATDSEGNLSGQLELPSDVTTGGHTIDIIGQDEAGDTVDIRQPVYISDSSDDSDGDGIANGVDSCPTATNSGIDIDRDGIDDTCDGFIGNYDVSNDQTATTTSPGSDSSSSPAPDEANSTSQAPTINAELTSTSSDSSDTSSSQITSSQIPITSLVINSSTLTVRKPVPQIKLVAALTHSKAVSPQVLGAHILQQSAKHQAVVWQQKPPIIHWRFWAIVLILFLLLLIILTELIIHSYKKYG